MRRSYHIQWSTCMSKLNLLETKCCAWNRKVFGLYRFNQQRFTTFGLYLKLGFHSIPVYLWFYLGLLPMLIPWYKLDTGPWSTPQGNTWISVNTWCMLFIAPFLNQLHVLVNFVHVLGLINVGYLSQSIQVCILTVYSRFFCFF
jgi:hypothetical protein